MRGWRSICGLLWLLRLAAVLTGVVASVGPVDARSIPVPATPDQGPACDVDPPDVHKAIWKSRSPSTQVWGYVDRHSVAAGGSFDLMLSTRPGGAPLQVRAEVFRIGHDPAGKRTLVWRSEPVGVDCQDASATAAAIGPGWRPSIRGVPTAGWRSGYYTVSAVMNLTLRVGCRTFEGYDAKPVEAQGCSVLDLSGL